MSNFPSYFVIFSLDKFQCEYYLNLVGKTLETIPSTPTSEKVYIRTLGRRNGLKRTTNQ